MEPPAPRSGVDPIIAARLADDLLRMTVLAPPYPHRAGRRRVLDSTGSRFEPKVRGDRVSTKMPEPRPDKIEALRALIERGEYTVDAAKVADAIVGRLLAGGSLQDSSR